MSFENNSAGISSPEDGMSGGPRNVQQQAAQKRMQQTQAQVDEVVGIMRVNVEKVLERDQKLSELDNRADALQQGAAQFEQQANKLKRKYWWKNLKMMIIMGVIVAVLIIIIVLVIKFSGEESSSSSGNNGNPVVDTPGAGNPASGNSAATATASPASK